MSPVQPKLQNNPQLSGPHHQNMWTQSHPTNNTTSSAAIYKSTRGSGSKNQSKHRRQTTKPTQYIHTKYPNHLVSHPTNTGGSGKKEGNLGGPPLSCKATHQCNTSNITTWQHNTPPMQPQPRSIWLPNCTNHPRQRYNFHTSHRAHSCPDCHNIIWEGPHQTTRKNKKMGERYR